MAGADDGHRPRRGTGDPRGRWTDRSTPDGARVPFGDPVRLVARVRDTVPIREIRFTAYYPRWARPNSVARLTGFDEQRTWRILAVCRPPGVQGEPARTRGCRWEGSDTDAVVTYVWDPTEPVSQKVTDWQPLTQVAISEDSDACVPVSLSFDVFDAAGYRVNAPDGSKRVERCRTATDKPGKVVNLEPPRPPATPGNVRVEYDPTSRSGCGSTLFPSQKDCTIRVRWRDRSIDETSFSVLVAPITRAEFEPCPGVVDSDCAEITSFVCDTLRLAARVPADRTSATVELRRSDHSGVRRRFDGLYCVVVIASNAAGDSAPNRTPHAMTVEWLY